MNNKLFKTFFNSFCQDTHQVKGTSRVFHPGMACSTDLVIEVIENIYMERKNFPAEKYIN